MCLRRGVTSASLAFWKVWGVCPPSTPKGAAKRSQQQRWDLLPSTQGGLTGHPGRDGGVETCSLAWGPAPPPQLRSCGTASPKPVLQWGPSWSSPVKYPTVLGSLCGQPGYFSFFPIKELISKKLEMSMVDINQKWPEDEHYPK